MFKSYPDVEGGYYYDKRRLEASWEARATLDDLITRASSQGSATLVTSDGKDLFVMEARRIAAPDLGAWTVKRLPGRNDPWTGQRAFLLAALALAALVSVAGAIATGARLHRGIAEIRRGLIALEQDFEYSLPQRNDELGEISAAIMHGRSPPRTGGRGRKRRTASRHGTFGRRRGARDPQSAQQHSPRHGNDRAALTSKYAAARRSRGQ